MHPSLIKFFKAVYRILYITAFAFLYSVGVSLFLNPNNLAPGGLTGVSIMVNHVAGLPTGLVYFCINIPVLLLGFFKLGKKLFFKTLLAIAISTTFMDILESSDIGPLTTNPILAAVYGGMLVAIAIAFLFKAGTTTGGVDIIINLLKLRYPHIEVGKFFFMIDVIIVSLSAIVFKSIESALYAAITIFVSSFFIDKILYRTDQTLMMFIISEREADISSALLHNVDVGATLLSATGGYDGKKKKVIMCAMKKFKYPKAEKMIYDIDKDAFIIITSAKDILGKGFKTFSSQ
ncbi:MAG: YitT family protein [Lachnospiraceae bacterium]|nr:YitT family protein [Lachnospiraceae bacterium]